MSELGAVGAPYAAFMNVLGTGIFGLSAIVFAVGLRRALGGGYAAWAISLFIGIAGAAGIAQGIFPCDSGCVPITLSGTLHQMIGILPLIAMLIATELLAFSGRARNEWRGSFIATPMAAAATILFTLGLFSGADYIGLFQRLLIGTITLFTPCRQIAQDP